VKSFGEPVFARAARRLGRGASAPTRPIGKTSATLVVRSSVFVVQADEDVVLGDGEIRARLKSAFCSNRQLVGRGVCIGAYPDAPRWAINCFGASAARGDDREGEDGQGDPAWRTAASAWRRL
jgi:hypothetical protein